MFFYEMSRQKILFFSISNASELHAHLDETEPSSVYDKLNLCLFNCCTAGIAAAFWVVLDLI